MTARLRRTWDRADLRALSLPALFDRLRGLSTPQVSDAQRRERLAALEELAARLRGPDLKPSPSPHRGRGGVRKNHTP